MCNKWQSQYVRQSRGMRWYDDVKEMVMLMGSHRGMQHNEVVQEEVMK